MLSVGCTRDAVVSQFQKTFGRWVPIENITIGHIPIVYDKSVSKVSKGELRPRRIRKINRLTDHFLGNKRLLCAAIRNRRQKPAIAIRTTHGMTDQGRHH